jgi:hypothetical protein
MNIITRTNGNGHSFVPFRVIITCGISLTCFTQYDFELLDFFIIFERPSTTQTWFLTIFTLAYSTLFEGEEPTYSKHECCQ